MNVPFLDLKQQYQQLSAEIQARIQEVCDSTAFILGPQVGAFEKEFADFLETPHVIGLASGTDALHVAFRALDLQPGDEVLMPANTFVATAIGVMLAGGRPRVVEIDPETHLIDYDKIEAAITPKTKVLCPVHLYGRACNMDRIMEIASKHSLAVVEDTAQAHGARWKGKRVGTFGEFGCYSFYPGKNLGAYGDAGALSTNSEALALKARQMRNYGSEIKYHHPEFGFNSRLDSIQASVLSVKLPHLASWSQKRWSIAAHYNEGLQQLHQAGKLTLPDIRTADEHVFHLFVVQVDDRDVFMKALQEKGVSTGIHYPVPFHVQGGFAELGYKEGDFPIAEGVAKRIVSLPMFPEMTSEQASYVVKVIQEYFG